MEKFINEYHKSLSRIKKAVFPTDSWTKEDYEQLEIVEAALSRQIPEKPLEYAGWEGQCPNCRVVFLDRSTNFCGNCGQALAWEEEK